jgi:hypothetical protein
MIRFSCDACGKQFVATYEYGGRRTKCTKCGIYIKIPFQSSRQPAKAPPLPFPMVEPNRPHGIDLGINIEEQSSPSDEPPKPRHSVLGVAATILGAFGSLLLLAYFSLPPEDVIKDNVGAIGLTLNMVGLGVAAASFGQANRLRFFSWSGLILSGWLLALFALIVLVMLAAGRSGGKWGFQFCPHCFHTWYPRGSYFPARCPRCQQAL